MFTGNFADRIRCYLKKCTVIVGAAYCIHNSDCDPSA